ncbi:hypothetical protein WJX73_006353 [Symbiochloris irregularis]|uniref:pyridoxal kinase n=1 Tax=Symbiochloris irregularis TaxID=706552 RepID=A0AAW1PVY5_9CHLO
MSSGSASPGHEGNSAPRVLSIQSHVVHGYVGNRCAVFPLQRLGFDVDFINSVQFSNHTGYPTVKGGVLDGDALWELLEGLQKNDLLQYDYLVTGYIGSLSFLQKIVKVVEVLRRHNSNLTYVCDPVMGDEGKLYVPGDLPSAYRDTVVPLASILTPNQYEAEQLLGSPISSFEDAERACETLLARGPHTVVLTSFSPENADASAIWVIAATSQQQQGQGSSKVKLRIPHIEGSFTGTGDLLTALLLAWLHRLPGDLPGAVEHAIAGLQGVLRATAESCRPLVAASGTREQVCKARELCLIQNQGLLEAPDIQLRAEPL